MWSNGNSVGTKAFNEGRIRETAEDIVGGYENSVQNGEMEVEDIDFDDMLKECVGTAMTFLPKEVRFVGKKRATQICKGVVDSFMAY